MVVKGACNHINGCVRRIQFLCFTPVNPIDKFPLSQKIFLHFKTYNKLPDIFIEYSSNVLKLKTNRYILDELSWHRLACKHRGKDLAPLDLL